MASHFYDYLYTKSFTPREYQVELLHTAKQKNIIICLGKYTEQTFIVTKLIQEHATGNRALGTGTKRIIYLLDSEESCSLKSTYIEQLTDLKVTFLNHIQKNHEFTHNFLSSHVLITTTEIFYQMVKAKEIRAEQINLLIFDQCHLLINNEHIRELLRILKSTKRSENLRVIGLAIPLLDLTEQPGRLKLEIDRLESTFQCDVDTTSDILSILRYSSKPKEYIIEYTIPTPGDLHSELKAIVLDAYDFMLDHRYDPTEIYEDEFSEDIQKIPDPKKKPREMLDDFLDILDTLGPWCADRAALSLLSLSEKLKIKTPYDRHFLLLNIVGSVMMKVRAICDEKLSHVPEKERIYQYSTSKVHRLLDILKSYAPLYTNKTNTNNGQSIFRRNFRNNDTSGSPRRNNLPLKPGETFPNRRVKFTKPHRGFTDPNLLCGVIFVDKSLTAKIVFSLLSEICKCDQELSFLSPLYTIEKNVDEFSPSRDPEVEHKKQEEVLKRFRMHECNLLVATAILEEGIEIPKCNFVMRFDFPKTYRSYVYCKSRARTPNAIHVLLVSDSAAKENIWQLAQYHYIEEVLIRKCSAEEPGEAEEEEADKYAPLIPVYQPIQGENGSMVTFKSAISLVNRYCAKLPSDTFTRLTPEWLIHEVQVDRNLMYTCSLRLPINSPLKYTITSSAMPSRAMARRLAALELCIRLHKVNEVDDNLLPIGKENFKARPEDAEVPPLPDEYQFEHTEARPGTTKRRQYYYKKTGEALTDCRPSVGVPCYLYHIKMMLSCPLPEEQNTRGRRIYPPEDSEIGFGILTLKKIPKLCPFPIYTRSGEVHVELRLSKNTVVLDSTKIERVSTFLNYTFTNVLKLQKYLMIFDPNASEYSYLIVPVRKTNVGDDINVDWDFLQLIYHSRNTIPTEVKEEDRVNFKFDPAKYTDAVIMPWYRNQDQPQYFYVAEICRNLSPKSHFPGEGYRTFEEYYYRKYRIKIQNTDQPLLDVDHTSARLNFLTPRYVNRKGVALPTSSEETKRAKRENLEQKQILVAELCAIHPFPASLWRQAVCLPCILYRINALLLADQIRCEVARMINLGKEHLAEDFEWPALNFGWSLAEVLRKSKEMKKNEPKATIEPIKPLSIHEITDESEKIKETINNWTEAKPKPLKVDGKLTEMLFEDVTELLGEDDYESNELEIGTWSNDMATESMCNFSSNITVHSTDFGWDKDPGEIRCGSPNLNRSNLYEYSSDGSYSDGDFIESSEESDDDTNRGLIISYVSENTAEAVEDEEKIKKMNINKKIMTLFDDSEKKFSRARFSPDPLKISHFDEHNLSDYEKRHFEFAQQRELEIISNGSFIKGDEQIALDHVYIRSRKQSPVNTTPEYNPDLAHFNYIKQIGEKMAEHIASDKALGGIHYAQNHGDNIPVPALDDPLETDFSFDYQPELRDHPGPSPSLILQALTMSNANDGINLERLETIGDSFLKYAITTYLYCSYPVIHEGKLSHLRSRQVSNLNLYRLGKRKVLGESMIATKFEPHDNWLPPCYYVPRELEQVFIESGVPANLWNQVQDLHTLSTIDISEISQLIQDTEYKLGIMRMELDKNDSRAFDESFNSDHSAIPYNLITQHSIPDKSIADCVEALIGAYLIACGPRGALLFMTWLGIHVLPTVEVVLVQEEEPLEQYPGSTPYVKGVDELGRTTWSQTRYGKLEEPRNPLMRYVPDPEGELSLMLDGYEKLEEYIQYKFKDRSYLLQAFTHASYQQNRLTDCYQRLEFLGDAVLDYLITRHLYEDSRQHSPGALTDLRSALVNNTIFASLAVRCGFQKYFRHLSPGLNVVIDKFVRIQEENGHSISEEYYLIAADECEEAEDVEVPKALGDVFESLAGAIYLDSGMSLDAVWSVYYRIMKSEIEQFSTNVPKSPIRELLELEPETAKFSRPEKLADGRTVRVTVDVFGKGSFKGIGRNYRIAKCTAAKCALKKLKKMQSTSQRQKI